MSPEIALQALSTPIDVQPPFPRGAPGPVTERRRADDGLPARSGAGGEAASGVRSRDMSKRGGNKPKRPSKPPMANKGPRAK